MDHVQSLTMAQTSSLGTVNQSSSVSAAITVTVESAGGIFVGMPPCAKTNRVWRAGSRSCCWDGMGGGSCSDCIWACGCGCGVGVVIACMTLLLRIGAPSKYAW
eukprot:scaffold133803_cov105-Phaeocystis_antarctica.AAC.2